MYPNFLKPVDSGNGHCGHEETYSSFSNRATTANKELMWKWNIKSNVDLFQKELS